MKLWSMLMQQLMAAAAHPCSLLERCTAIAGLAGSIPSRGPIYCSCIVRKFFGMVRNLSWLEIPSTKI